MFIQHCFNFRWGQRYQLCSTIGICRGSLVPFQFLILGIHICWTSCIVCLIFRSGYGSLVPLIYIAYIFHENFSCNHGLILITPFNQSGCSWSILECQFYGMLMVSLKYARTPFILWLQKGNVSNQREHIVHLLANEQSRLGKVSGNEPVCVFIVSVSHVFFSLVIFLSYWCPNWY